MDISPIQEVLRDADCIIHMVIHDDSTPYMELDNLSKFVKPNCVIVDTQYVFSPSETELKGFTYRGIGRGNWK